MSGGAIILEKLQLRKVGLPPGFEHMITKKLTRAQNIKSKENIRIC
jgi:hypothetical protein